MADRDWLVFFLGMVTFIVLEHNIPILRQLNTVGTTTNLSISNSLKLEDIKGIDITSLGIAKQKGLM